MVPCFVHSQVSRGRHTTEFKILYLILIFLIYTNGAKSEPNGTPAWSR